MTVEERVRAAMRAIAGEVHEVRSLALPDAQPAARPRLRRRRWMAPMMAAAAVIAVALTLVMVRGARNAQPGPPSPVSPAGSGEVPEYYVALNDASPGRAPHQIVVGNTFTGARLATISAPAHTAFSGVTGAADDRTFIVGAKAFPYSAHPDSEPRTWYLLRIAPGTDHPARLTKLPIPATPSGLDVVGLALSPDGTKFAVAVQRRLYSSGPETLRTYSVATGALLGTWTGPASGSDSADPLPVTTDDNIYLSWLGDGHTVMFDYGGVRMLDTSHSGHDLIKGSRPVPVPQPWDKAPPPCSEPVVTSDGMRLACVTFGHAAFAEYSTATGKLIRTLYRYRPSSIAEGAILWASPSGDTLIGLLRPNGTVADPAQTMVGVVTQGKFRRLSFPLASVNPVPNGIAW